MADTTTTSNASTTSESTVGAPCGPEAAVPPRRYRARGTTARDKRVTTRFTDAELSVIEAAAGAAQMTVTGFCALAALAVAGRAPGRPDGAGDGSALTVEGLAEMQRELFAARTAVNRTGVNLNQAVAQLNSTGRAPVWLEHAVGRVTRAVAGVDQVTAELHRRLA